MMVIEFYMQHNYVVAVLVIYVDLMWKLGVLCTRTRGYQINFALGYLAGAHLRFYLMVFKSDPPDECECTL